MPDSKLFSEALKDVTTLVNSLKMKAEMEVIKENEEKINKIFLKLLENEEKIEDDETSEINQEENVTQQDTETEEDKTITDNSDFIDSILDDIEIGDIIAQSDVEIEYKDKIDDNNTDETNDDSIEEFDVEETELNEYIQKENMENNQIKKENQKLTETQIEETLQEMEEIILDDETDSTDDSDFSMTGLDEEDQAFLDELNTMSEEEFAQMLSEISVEDDVVSDDEEIDLGDETITEEDEIEIDLEELEDMIDDELEEGISVTTQTQKTVGSSASQQRQGYPERRSNLSEETIQEFEKLKSLTNKLLEENKKLKDINNDSLKRLETIKNKLYEATVVSHKTAFVNQLLFEHSLNQKQKTEIIEKFSQADTIEQSKNVFNILKEGFSNKKIIRESVEEKITKTVVGSEVGKINETKLYHQTNPELKKMLDLINYDPKKI